MFFPEGQVRVFLYGQPVSMRLSLDGRYGRRRLIAYGLAHDFEGEVALITQRIPQPPRRQGGGIFQQLVRCSEISSMGAHEPQFRSSSAPSVHEAFFHVHSDARRPWYYFGERKRRQAKRVKGPRDAVSVFLDLNGFQARDVEVLPAGAEIDHPLGGSGARVTIWSALIGQWLARYLHLLHVLIGTALRLSFLCKRNGRDDGARRQQCELGKHCFHDFLL